MMRILTGLVAAATLCAMALANVAPPVLVPETRARETVLAFLENVNAGSAEGVASTYSDQPGFLWVEQGHIAYRTKAEAVAGIAAALQSMKGVRMETGDDFTVTVVDENTVFAAVPITMFMTDASGKESEMGRSLTTMTLVREGGEWRILTGHTAADPAP